MDHILQTKAQKYFRKLKILKCVAPDFLRGVNGIFALLEFNGIYLLITKLRCVTSQKNKYVILASKRNSFSAITR
jgi:hypothetical protein